MVTSRLTEFGPCGCGGSVELHPVEVRLGQDLPEPVVLDGVAQGRCPNCGGRFYKAATLHMIEAELRRVRQPQPSA